MESLLCFGFILQGKLGIAALFFSELTLTNGSQSAFKRRHGWNL